MIFDLLWDDAKLANEILSEYRPQVAKEECMDHWRDVLEG